MVGIFNNFVEQQKNQAISDQIGTDTENIPSNNSQQSNRRRFRDRFDDDEKKKKKGQSGFTKKEQQNIFDSGGFLNKKQRKKVTEASEKFKNKVKEPLGEANQKIGRNLPSSVVADELDKRGVDNNLKNRTGEFFEGVAEGAASLGNVPAFVKSADNVARVADDAGKLASNPKDTAVTAGAIGSSTIDSGIESFKENPSKSVGQIGGNIAAGFGVGSATAKASRFGLAKASKASRRVRGQDSIDATEIAEEDIVDNPVQNFPEFEDQSNAKESFIEQSREKTPDKIKEQFDSEPAEDEAIGFQVNRFGFEDEFEVQNPKTRPSDPEGTLFTAPSASLAFSSAGGGRSFSPNLIPRLSDFTPNKDQIVATKIGIKRTPDDVGNEKATRDFSEPVNVEEGGLLGDDQEFFAGDESRFFADSDRDFTDDDRAEQGVGFVRSKSNRTPEAEALIPEGTKFKEVTGQDDIFTNVGDTNLEIRAFKPVRDTDSDVGDTGGAVDDIIGGAESAEDVSGNGDELLTADDIARISRSNRRSESGDPTIPSVGVSSPSRSSSVSSGTSTGFSSSFFSSSGSSSSSTSSSSSGSSISSGFSSGLGSSFGVSSGSSSSISSSFFGSSGGSSSGSSGLSSGFGSSFGGSSGSGSSGGSSGGGSGFGIGGSGGSGSSTSNKRDEDESEGDPFNLGFGFDERNTSFENEFADLDDIF